MGGGVAASVSCEATPCHLDDFTVGGGTFDLVFYLDSLPNLFACLEDSPHPHLPCRCRDLWVAQVSGGGGGGGASCLVDPDGIALILDPLEARRAHPSLTRIIAINCFR